MSKLFYSTIIPPVRVRNELAIIIPYPTRASGISSPRGLVPHKNRGVTGDYGVNDEIVITSKLLVNCSLLIVNGYYELLF